MRNNAFLKKTGIALIILTSMAFMAGCNKEIQIFEDPSLRGKMETVKSGKLEEGLFYVKSGTDFHPAIELHGTEDVLYAEEYVDTTIPTCYKGEVIVQASQGESFTDVSLVRYRDLGYGPGVYRANIDSERNEVTFNKSGVQKESSFYKIFDKLESPNIRVLTIEGEELSNKHISPNTGVIYNYNKKDVVSMTIYSGTYYHEIQLYADTELFERMEEYGYDSTYVSDTQNGYKSFSIPEDLKSGYYRINSGGIFRYVDFERGEGDPENTDYNIPGENAKKSEIKTSRQYSINLDNDMANLRIVADYNDEFVDNENIIKGTVVSPDGTEYEMAVDTENNTVSIDLTEAKTGRWQVNISPQDIDIVNIAAENITPKQELTEETYTVTINEIKNNILIVSAYKNINGRDQKTDTTVTGSVIDPVGQTYIMKNQKETAENAEYAGHLEADITYAPIGEYKVIINHYPDETEFDNPEIKDNISTNPDILVIEE